jgi:hypothetical protein
MMLRLRRRILTARLIALAALMWCATARLAVAGQGQNGDLGLPPSFDGPAPPQLPETIARDDQGRMTIRAVRLTTPLRIDGRLDEAAYGSVEPISDFIQMEPSGGDVATEKTETWLFFDRDNVYVAMRAWESRPDRMIANEMRRDNFNIIQGNDHFGFSFDTFYDRRNAAQFTVNPLGGRTDGQSTNERQYNGDWNPIWDVAVGRFEGGWTMEAAVPFKSLRYAPGHAQVWGFNARRQNKWKNEISYVARIPPAMGLGRGSFAASLFPTLVGIEAPAGAKNLEIKPYAIGDLTTDLAASPRISNDVGEAVGVDVKYGIGQSFTADFTVNTDFAQVEADEQQVNLTRFSLFFPEKREFFLENQGTFTFGGAGGMMAGQVTDTPLLFYSRRIGLTQLQGVGREVPISAGARLTGRSGRYSIGLIDIGTRDEPSARAVATNFAVVRIKRDILRRSSVGAILTSRSTAQNLAGSNEAYGVDGNFTFYQNLSFNAYWAKTRSDSATRDDTSFRAQMDYAGDRYGVQLERLDVGDNFNPEVGFVRRDNMRRHYAQLRFSPRPTSIPSVRKFSGIGTLTYIENGAGWLETRTTDGEFAIELQNSDRFSVGLLDSYEFLQRPFPIAPGVVIPTGGYDFTQGRIVYNFGQQRPVSGNLSVEHGTFYDGHITTFGFTRTHVNPAPRFSIEPTISINWVDLPYGAFTTKLIGSRVTYTMTPLMFTSALIQYNSSTNRVSSNLRLRWEYQPGSELFVVYNEERDTFAPNSPDLQNRALIVKINRLFRF